MRRTTLFPILGLYTLIVFAVPSLCRDDKFTISELNELYQSPNASPDLESRLFTFLHTPYIASYAPATRRPPHRSAKLGEFIRIAHWNIENGLEYDALEAAFVSDEKVSAFLDTARFPPGSEERRSILEQAQLLRVADVIVLNEVDWGLPRSGYRNVGEDLAKRLGMFFAYGVEFVELSPVQVSNELSSSVGPKDTDMVEALTVDPHKYRGFHGTAILSRFPMENVRLIPFKNQPYDWYEGEKKGVSFVEKFRRKLVKEVFLVDAMRQVRRGGRMMLICELTDPGFPAGRISIVATHLEIRTSPKHREIQLKEMLSTIKNIDGPVVVAGDMNTSTNDMTPTTILREFNKRFGKTEYWAKTGLNYLLGSGMFQDATMASLTFWRNHRDPTVRHIPIFMPNEERKFFSTLKEFRFADKGAFDFRGEALRAANGKKNTLANSNERDEKGFVTTFRMQRPVKFIGRYKLDWIFVKPVHLFEPSDYQGSYLLAPHFGRTLGAVNSIAPDRISDHSPLIVDLPLLEPNIPKKVAKKR